MAILKLEMKEKINSKQIEVLFKAIKILSF